MKVFMDVCRISFSLVGWVDSHRGGPDLIPADGMARGLTYPVAPEQIIVAAKSLFTCCVSFHAAAFVCRLVRSGGYCWLSRFDSPIWLSRGCLTTVQARPLCRAKIICKQVINKAPCPISCLRSV